MAKPPEENMLAALGREIMNPTPSPHLDSDKAAALYDRSVHARKTITLLRDRIKDKQVISPRYGNAVHAEIHDLLTDVEDVLDALK